MGYAIAITRADFNANNCKKNWGHNERKEGKRKVKLTKKFESFNVVKA